MKFWLVALCGVLASPLAVAAQAASLYTAEVPYDQQQRNARSTAYDEALQQVLMRVSGAELVGDRTLYEALFPEAEAYVVQFAPGQGPEETLVVTFDGDAIERTLRSAGQTVWGGDRPVTLVWLAVDGGQGQRLIVGAEDPESTEAPGDEESAAEIDNLRERVLDSAAQRGLPVVFPLLDSEDRRQIDFSDIWGGFDERVLAASERYDVDSVLIGRIRANDAAPSRWTYIFNEERRSWSGDPAYVIAEVSGVMSQQFAIAGNEPVRAVDLGVSGVIDADAFGELEKMLGNINVIEEFAITEVAGDRIRYRVSAHGGAARLARALRFEGLLEQERIDMSDFGLEDQALDSLEFFYSP